MRKIILLFIGFLLLSCSNVEPKVKKEKSKRSVVQLKGKYAIMDDRGVLLTPFKYESIRLLNNNYAAVSLKDSKYALMNSKKEILTAYKYSHITHLTANLYLTVISIWEESLMGENEPRMLHSNDSSGLINSNGDEIIPIEDKSMVKLIHWADRKMIQVLSKKGTAILDKKGNVFIPFGQYDSFEENKHITYIKVGKKGQGHNAYSTYGYIDTKGKIVIPPIYANVRYENGYFSIHQSFENNMTHGILNTKNEIVVPAKYQSVEFMGNGLFKAMDEVFRLDVYKDKGRKNKK
jgi:hypothetical protein